MVACIVAAAALTQEGLFLYNDQKVHTYSSKAVMNTRDKIQKNG